MPKTVCLARQASLHILRYVALSSYQPKKQYMLIEDPPDGTAKQDRKYYCLAH